MRNVNSQVWEKKSQLPSLFYSVEETSFQTLLRNNQEYDNFLFPEVMFPSLIRHKGDQYSSAMYAFMLCKVSYKTADAFNASNAVLLESLKRNKTTQLPFEDGIIAQSIYAIKKTGWKEMVGRRSHTWPNTKD